MPLTFQGLLMIAVSIARAFVVTVYRRWEVETLLRQELKKQIVCDMAHEHNL